MNHPSPASFPDPMQRIGTPVTPPHGTQPNPAYQDLLTLYAKVYGAEESLARALHPARRTIRGDQAWTGRAAQEWTSDLEAWSRRLAIAAERTVAELADRLRATPPYVPIGTAPMQPGSPQPGPLQPGSGPGSVPAQPGSGPGSVPAQPGTPQPGPLRSHPDPGGPLRSHPDPGGSLHPRPEPGGPERSHTP